VRGVEGRPLKDVCGPVSAPPEATRSKPAEAPEAAAPPGATEQSSRAAGAAHQADVGAQLLAQGAARSGATAKAGPAPAAAPGARPPVFTGFDDAKLAAPLKLQADGQPKSAKYTFAKLAQASGSTPQSKAEAERWFNESIRPGMEAAGFKVGWVKGDKALISTREHPEGEVIDFVRGAGSGDPNYTALAWQPEDGAGAAGKGGAAGAGAAQGAGGGPVGGARMPAGIADIFADLAGDPGLRAGASKEEREQALVRVRDAIIRRAREKGIDVAWNMKRGNGPLSLDALAYRRPDGGVSVIDFARASKDLTGPVKLQWLEVGGKPGYTLNPT